MNNDNKNVKVNDSRRRFNVMDAIIVILVLLCIVSIIYRFDFIDGIGVSDNSEEYRIYFEIEDIRNTSVASLVPGDTVRNAKTNEKIGVFDEIVQNIPALATYNNDGKEIYFPPENAENKYDETRYYVTGYITVSGRMTENGFLLN
ncbi:MAG: hypothetical protein IKB23_03780, partial [Clostridia bacterium]|nr:hypothetical protein [Clostridia bacterium]